MSADTLRARNRERIRRHVDRADKLARDLLRPTLHDVCAMVIEIGEALRIVADELEELEK